MDLKGSQTEKNMRAALSGESLARNKYTFFAMQARSEGHEESAHLFEEMAKNETTHAKIWFRYLNEGLGTTADNLKEAAAGEYFEWTSMYPEFSKKAREEGFEEIADMFDRVAGIEKDHEHRFLKAYSEFLMKTAKEGHSPTEQPADKAVTVVPGHRCMFCGATFEKRPDVCPVCSAIGSFEDCMIEK